MFRMNKCARACKIEACQWSRGLYIYLRLGYIETGIQV